jgi:hypothetical protein
LQSVSLDPFEIVSVDVRQTSVFFCDFSIELGELNVSICADENLDGLLNTLVKRNMIKTRHVACWMFCFGSCVTIFLWSSNPAVLRLVKFFLRNGMKGIKVKPSPYTAKQQVSLHAASFVALRAPHTLQLLQPDVITAMQHDLTQKFTTISAIASVAGSALGSVGRSLNI